MSYAATIRVLFNTLGLRDHLVCIWHRQDEYHLVIVGALNSWVASVRLYVVWKGLLHPGQPELWSCNSCRLADLLDGVACAGLVVQDDCAPSVGRLVLGDGARGADAVGTYLPRHCKRSSQWLLLTLVAERRARDDC